MSNQDSSIYIDAGQLLEAHGPARLLTQIEREGCCLKATDQIQRRGYFYGFRDESPFHIFTFEATGANIQRLPRRPILEIKKVRIDFRGGGGFETQDLGNFFIENATEGRIGSLSGFGGNELYPSQSGDVARLRKEGNPSIAGNLPRARWEITYTGGEALPKMVQADALALAKIEADELRAVAAAPDVVTTDRFSSAKDRILDARYPPIVR